MSNNSTDTISNTPNAKISLKLYYKLDFLHLIQEFVVEAAKAFGAQTEEMHHLRLASEEVAVHILENYPDTGFEDHFKITCEPIDNGVEFVFTNMGLPVNPKALPDYDADNPTETEDGLKFFLIKKLVDRFEFLNEGNMGWKTVIYKQLANFKDINTFSGATDRDAKKDNIVELAYHTYKYSYCKKSFYYTDMLENELENQQVVSYIAKLQSGRIVGHMALMVSDRCPQIAEFGAAMITPEFRGNKGFLELVGMFHNYMTKESPARKFVICCISI
ncbi:MAG: hypothetical protein B6I31_05645 [Desulfobacteraceae bacterium 4572_19]|nr:MAG: hypothetical protein B6I31_05645 [Desulfobacteraceae bacterium 4572_19]